MSTQDFDNHIHKQLSGYESPLATDAMWAAVDAGMSGGRKFGFWWLWMSIVLLLISFGGLAYHVVNNQVNPQALAEVAHTLPASEPMQGANAQSHAEQPVHQAASAKERFATAAVTNSDIQATFDNRTTPPIESHESQQVDNPSMGYAQGIILEAAIEQDKAVDAIGASASKIFVNTSLLPSSEGTEATFQGPVEASTAAENLSEAPPVPLVADFASTHARYPPEALLVPFLAEAADPTVMPFKKISLSNAPMLPSFAHMGSLGHYNPSPGYKDHMFIRIEAGTGLTDRRLEGQASAYLAQREQTERPLEYLSTQLSAGWQFNNGVYLLSGISMTRINEHFVHTQYIIDIDQHSHVSNIHVIADGDSLFTYITTDVVSQTTTTYSHYNRYTLIDLPIAVGYEWQWARWSVGLEAGALLNLNFRSSGSMLSPNDEVLRLEESNMFRQRINWSYTGQVRLAYALNEHWRIEVAPGMRIIPGSVLLSSDMKQSYTLFGAQFGLRYSF